MWKLFFWVKMNKVVGLIFKCQYIMHVCICFSLCSYFVMCAGLHVFFLWSYLVVYLYEKIKPQCPCDVNIYQSARECRQNKQCFYLRIEQKPWDRQSHILSPLIHCGCCEKRNNVYTEVILIRILFTFVVLYQRQTWNNVSNYIKADIVKEEGVVSAEWIAVSISTALVKPSAIVRGGGFLLI